MTVAGATAPAGPLPAGALGDGIRFPFFPFPAGGLGAPAALSCWIESYGTVNAHGSTACLAWNRWF
nr:MAG TPA: hypothetical protein [Caudoviricetes sp.]